MLGFSRKKLDVQQCLGVFSFYRWGRWYSFPGLCNYL